MDTARIGLPEVKLGLLPGAGGTQRLPRLIGVERALKFILSGEPMTAVDGLSAGIIDHIVDGDLVPGAVLFAEQLLKRQAPLRRIRDLTLNSNESSRDFFARERARVIAENDHLIAPARIVDAVEAAANTPFDVGLAREKESFMECMESSQAKALQHLFFAERKAAVLPTDTGTPKSINLAAVLGAGTMGVGIAMSLLDASVPVTLLELNHKALERGVGIITKNYERAVARGRLTSEQAAKRLSKLTPVLSYDQLNDADLIVEAVYETMEIKREVFSALDRVAKQDAVLASNTSFLSIDEIALSTARPGAVLGMHFFSPANVMRLLEIVRGKRTDQDVLARVVALSKRMGKVGVVCNNSAGFIGNRMLSGYGYQALMLSLEGASVAQIDAALRGFGMPMGYFQMADLAGLDIFYRSRQDRDPASFDRRVTFAEDRLVEMKRLGQKSSAGYYDYAQGNRRPQPSELVESVITEVSRSLGIERRRVSDEEIVERCMLALVNVGCQVLDEGVAAKASDVDVVYVHGYGFPPHLGGPMYWAENSLGLDAALRKLNSLSAKQGTEWWSVSPYLQRRSVSGKGFGSITAAAG